MNKHVIGIGLLALAFAMAIEGSSQAQGGGLCNATPGLHVIHSGLRGMPLVDPMRLVPPTNWAWYANPRVPNIAWAFPPGWRAITVGGGDAFNGFTGGRLDSPDGRAAWEYVAGVTQRMPSPRQVAYHALERIVSQGQMRAICADDYQQPGTMAPSSFVAVTGGGVTAAVAAHVFSTGGPASYVYGAIRAPSAQFDQFVGSVFLVVSESMPKGYSCDENGPDSDGDGVSDSCDKYPNDPTRH